MTTKYYLRRKTDGSDWWKKRLEKNRRWYRKNKAWKSAYNKWYGAEYRALCRRVDERIAHEGARSVIGN